MGPGVAHMMKCGTGVVLVRRPGPRVAEVDALAGASGLHPEMVRRLLTLGLVDARAPDAPARLARAMRLRRDLGLNYAGAVLVCELLARIDDLETRTG